MREQTTQALENIKHVLQSIELDVDHIVKVTVFLTQAKLMAEMNAAYREFFRGREWPARFTLCGVELARPEFLVEIEVVAALAT